MLQASIKNFSYKKMYEEELENFDYKDINTLPSKCLLNYKNKVFAISKWVSPKRTRSYPYARIYDTFDSLANKVITIIPIFKDEGISGDMDYLQWDTISLMSLLNIYVIIGFYDNAQKHTKIENKITKQYFNNKHIQRKLDELSIYHQSALHWNLKELNKVHCIGMLAKTAYTNIAHTLNIQLHNIQNIDKFIEKITQDKDSFMNFSRNKAMRAQNRESLTIQPKEHVGIGTKTKITIQNYLGGQYFFTIDDVIYRDNMLYICESKHSKTSLLPSSDDIKDGLLKLMLYNNLDSIDGYKRFKVILRLTSDVLQDKITLPSNTIESFLSKNAFSKIQNSMLANLNKEAKINNFEIWINNDTIEN